MLDKLIKLLIDMKLKPTSGWGLTIIKWKEDKIVFITKEERVFPENVN